MRRILFSAVLCATAVPAAAGADSMYMDTREPTAIQSVSPEMRDGIAMRMGPDQRVSELVETTVLNRLALEHDAVRNLHRSGNGYSAEVLTAEGSWEPVTVDTTDWDISG